MKLWTSFVILITQHTIVSVPPEIEAASLVVLLYQVQELTNLSFLWAYTAFCLYVSGYPYHIMFNLSHPYPLDCDYLKGKGWAYSSLMFCERVKSLAA